ncbi:hypothetical protein BV22DRAFT_1127687 [Leucogyrophana mollusca]|uniref:Uncharacterized protein n=1 Tax=Leucogyrophana mollusca TaxID=85980 RepID=A0ACB8BMA5_9AGAM|nr:hypothetical protein BV22DRAFT_1127687 [Leucogyrophana mollusca]
MLPHIKAHHDEYSTPFHLAKYDLPHAVWWDAAKLTPRIAPPVAGAKRGTKRKSLADPPAAGSSKHPAKKARASKRA